MASKKKRIRKNSWGYVVLAFLGLLAATLLFLNVLEKPPAPSSVFIVQKNPLPDTWGSLDFVHHRSAKEKQDAAIAVVYNEMLSRIETLLAIPSPLTHDAVVLDSARYLKQVYGTAQAVPADVFRIACLKIYNVRVGLMNEYKGSHKKFEIILYQVIDEYYFQGKPPASLSISSVEDYHRTHSK